MKATSAAAKLNEQITRLQALEKQQQSELKDDFEELLENLSPGQLIKNAFHKLTDTPGFRSNLLATVTGLVAGVIGKKLIPGKRTGFLTRLVGPVVQVFLTNFVRNKLSRNKATDGNGQFRH